MARALRQHARAPAATTAATLCRSRARLWASRSRLLVVSITRVDARITENIYNTACVLLPAEELRLGRMRVVHARADSTSRVVVIEVHGAIGEGDDLALLVDATLIKFARTASWRTTATDGGL